MKLSDAVNAILERPAMRRNRKLHDQIDEANESITSNLAEGFEQQSDAAFARFLYISKGSAAEVATRLGEAYRKRCITLDELTKCRDMAESVGKQLGGFIKYLAECDFKDRGRFRSKGRRNTVALSEPTSPHPEDEGSEDTGSEDQG